MAKTKHKEKLMPAIPPEDYKGSVGKWMIELQKRGFWNGKKPAWHGDVKIPESVWWDMLEQLEK